MVLYVNSIALYRFIFYFRLSFLTKRRNMDLKSGLRYLGLFFFLLLTFAASAQYGPMGIGNKDGTPTSAGDQPRLLLWLDGSSVTQTNGGYVTTWLDRSGNGHDFTASGNNRPKFLSTGGPSGKPCLSFDSTGTVANKDRMVCTNFALPGNGYSIYFVIKTNDDHFGLFSYATASEPHEVLIYNDNGIRQEMNGAIDRASQIGDLSNNDWNYGGILWDNSTGYLWEYTDENHYENQSIIEDNFGYGITISSNGTAVIGDIQNTLNGGYLVPNAFHGRIAELIVFEGFLDKAQTRLMRTYLWTKYGGDFDIISNQGWDKFHGFDSGSGAKYYEPIGIGLDNGGSTGGTQSESRSKGLVLFVNDGDWTSGLKYLCAGLANDVTNTIVTSYLSAITPTVQSRWSRVWEIGTTSNGINQQFQVGFDFGEGIDGEIPQNVENYVLLWRSYPNSGNFQVFDASKIAEKYVLDDEVVFRIKADQITTTGRYYTLGTTNDVLSPLIGAPIRTWYAYQSGNWNSPTTWTLDGSAAPSYINPDNLTPGDNDNIYIGSGRTVTVNVDNLAQGFLKVYGTLDVGTAATPSFTEIAGSGSIRCAGNGTAGNFPTGNATAFADAINGGTTEFYGNGGFTQSSDLLLNKVKINFSSAANAMTLAADMTHNGLFEVTTGTFIVNNSDNISRTITSNADVFVASNGTIKVSASTIDRKHTWNFYKDLINNGGTIKFTNRTDPNYTANETEDYIEARFISDTNNQELRANGSSTFSRIVINKGADMTYILSLTSTNAAYFKLYGPCQDGMGDSQYYDEDHNQNSFALINGTAEITENIFIPLQINNGNYNINYTAQLWVNGGEVTKGPPVGTGEISEALVNYGSVKVTDGILNVNCRSGITIRENGIIQIDGGKIYTNQIRTSMYGPGHIGGLIINGGEVHINGDSPGGTNPDYYTLSLTYPGNLFRMTGGELHVSGPSSSSTGLIYINSDPGSTSVSGGEVIVDVINNADNQIITSRAAFWDLTIKRSTTGSNKHVKIRGGTSGNPGGPAGSVTTISQPDLIVRNKLTISGSNNPVLEMGSSGATADLYLYGNLIFGGGSQYIHHNNTTHFVGSANSYLSFGGSTAFPFFNVVVDKDFDSRFVKIQPGGSTVAMDILGNLDLEKGYFINGDRHVEVKGNIINKTQFGDEASTGYLRMNGNTGRQNIISSDGVFHKLVIDNPSGVALVNDGMTIKTWLKMEDGSLFIGDNKLRFETTSLNPVLTSGFNGTDRFIVCSGNPSAGGVEILNHVAGQHLVFPFGVSTGSGQKYTRADVYLNGEYVDDGFIRITPVDTLLSTSDINVGTDYLNFYWRVKVSGYNSAPNITHRFYYDDSDVMGAESGLSSGRVLSEMPFTRSVDDSPSSPSHINASTNEIYYNGDDQAQGTTGSGTPLVNADYSAGDPNRFVGEPDVFFSRNATIDAAWNVPGNWNTCVGCTDPYEYHGTSAPAVQATTEYPQAGDIAFIGFDVSNQKPHVYKAPAGGIEAAEVRFTPLQNSGGDRLPRYNGSGPANLGILRPTLHISNTSDIIKVQQISGEGELMLSGNIDLGVSDINGFLEEDSSVIVIKNPTLSRTEMDFLPATIPNLFVAYASPSVTSDLHIRGDLEVAGTSTLYLSTSLNGNIEIDHDLILDQYQSSTSDAQILFNKTGYAKTIVVHGDVKLFGAKAYIGVNPSTGAPVIPEAWTPDQIGAFLWLDASDASTVTLSGGYVTNWTNKVSSGLYSASQDTIGKRPTTGSLNGKTTIDFDGTDDFLEITHNAALNIPAAQDFEIFTVVKSDVQPNASVIYAKGKYDQTDFLLYLWQGKYKAYVDVKNFGYNSGPDVNTNANLGWSRRQGNSAYLYNTISGTSSQSGVSSASMVGNTHNVTIGAMKEGTLRFFDGDIAEIILVKHALTMDERQRMEGYLAHKWGLEDDLPTGHPYKDYIPYIGGYIETPNQLVVEGDIIQDLSYTASTSNGIELYSTTPGPFPDTTFVTLVVSGTGNNEFENSSGPVPRLWKLTVDKGIDMTSSFTFNTDVDIAGPADEVEKPVNLQNGLLKFNDSNIDLTLSSGGGDFVIPGSAGLELNSGSLHINGFETGMLLVGTLEITGGTMDIGDTEGENNYIEYASSGAPKLIVSGGTLTVGSQIRRGLSSIEGALDYRQSGGDVILGRYGASATNRGVLEILNEGSRLELTGGTLTFVRGVNSTSTPSLLLNPDFDNVSSTAHIYIGNDDSPSGAAIQNFGINSSVALSNLTIDNTSDNNPSVNLITHELELKGTLDIDAGSELNCFNHNLLLHSNVHNDGRIISLSGNVEFIHSDTATVDGSGSYELYNLVRSGGSSGQTQVGTDLLVKNDFTNDAGEILFGDHTLTVKGDVTTDGTIGFSTASNGLIFEGEQPQKLKRTAAGTTQIDVITVNNPQGVSIPTSANYHFIIDKNLRLESGVFALQGNLLEMNPNSEFTAVNPFGEDNMISTGGAFTNFGVKIHIPANFTGSVFAPLGIVKYMPIYLDFSQTGFSSGTTASTYLLKLNIPEHSLIVNDTESPFPEITDLDNVLGMYFTVDGENVGNGLRMQMQFNYDDSYVQVTSPYAEDDYIAARVYSEGTSDIISKFSGASDVDETGNIIFFTIAGDYSGVASAVDGDFFAGIDDAIPDIVPSYTTTNGGGNVNAGTTTYIYDVPGGGAPTGARVNVVDNDVLILNVDGINLYRTVIAAGATVKVDATGFHRLGRVTGSGTIHLVGTGNLPSGDYTDFFGCSGGKLIYEGRDGDNFEILANLPNIKKVDIIGNANSDLAIANNDVNVCTTLTVDGPRVKAANNAVLTINDDLVVASGSFDFRQGNALIKGDLITQGGASTGGSILSGNTGTTTIEGDIQIGGQSFNLGTFSRRTELQGDIIRTAGTITGGTGGARLVFNGTTPQTITGDFVGSNAIPNLEIDNTSGLTLTSANVDISDTLKLTAGNIFTSSGNILKLANDGADVDPEGGSADSFIDGPMQWTLLSATAERIFPVGKDERYRPLGLSTRSATRTWEVEYYDTVATVQPPVTSLDPDPTNSTVIETVSIQEHWRVNSNTTSPTTAKVRLSWGDNSAVSTEGPAQSNLVVLGYDTDGDIWKSYGGDDFSYVSVTNRGDFISITALPFTERFITLGSSDALNPLPVTWLYFRGETHGEAHTLTWATASERDNNYFELERSLDAHNWKPIARVTASGHSTSTRTYSYTDHKAPFGRVYYRLKQVDFDAKFDYAPNIVSLERTPKSEAASFDFILYPNPTSNDPVRFRLSNVANTIARVIITDLTGKQIQEDKIAIDGRGESAPMVCNFVPGIYLVTVIVNQKILTKPLVVAR